MLNIAKYSNMSADMIDKIGAEFDKHFASDNLSAEEFNKALQFIDMQMR